MNILFVCYGNLNSNSGLHIFHLANELADCGDDCIVFVPESKSLTSKNGFSKFLTLNYDDLDTHTSLFENFSGPDIIHVWTPREYVRKFVLHKLSKKFSCPYLVHLEDNEEFLFEKAIGVPVSEYADIDVPSHISHPVKYKKFISKSSGITALIKSLFEFKPDRLPGLVIWPGFDEIFENIPKSNIDLKNRLGIPFDNNVLVYMGNCHVSNREEIFSLYLAVHALNRRGTSVTLVRTGKNWVPVMADELRMLEENCIELGFLERNELPGLLSLADILVQPGRPNKFNNYRFPSKIPDFLISGKPVILPRTNIGLKMESEENCIFLETGDSIDIANKINLLINTNEISLKIGEKGAVFARENCSWKIAAQRLREFYNMVLTNQRN